LKDQPLHFYPNTKMPVLAHL